MPPAPRHERPQGKSDRRGQGNDNARPPTPALFGAAGDFPTRRIAMICLAGILVLAAGLRLYDLSSTPPGLNQDEAANAYNAYCLLNTGKDQAGVSWPIFTMRCLGGYSSTLYIYYLIPFLAVGGLNIWTIRFSSAVAGLAAVALTYYVAARLCNRKVGLAAAAFMALAPWAIEQSRWGHEAAQVPGLLLATLAMMLWARLPLDDRQETPRVLPALAAGIVGGISCYGYQTLRLFIPLLLVAMVAVNVRGWLRCLKSAKGALALAGFALGFAITFGPLAWNHLTDPNVGQRGITTMVWQPDDSALTKIEKAAERYPGHFGLDFLFQKGDFSISNHDGRWGQLHWYALPLMLLGLVAIVANLRRSPAARGLLVWLILYPIGSTITRHPTLHALRSLPGLPILMILAGLGLVAGLCWLGRLNRVLVKPVLAGVALVVLITAAYHAYVTFALPRNLNTEVYLHDDFVQACRWLKPRMDGLDAVFVAPAYMNQPYIVSMVVMDYPPREWLYGPKNVVPYDEWDRCMQYGKMHFIFDDTWRADRDRLQQAGKNRIVFLLRPWMLANMGNAYELLAEFRCRRYDDVTLVAVEM